MGLKVLEAVNLADLGRCAGLKLSPEVTPSGLRAYANQVGYLLPRDAEEEHGPLEEWDAWVLVLAAAKGRCILRAMFGEAELVPPKIGDMLRGTFRESVRAR